MTRQALLLLVRARGVGRTAGPLYQGVKNTPYLGVLPLTSPVGSYGRLRAPGYVRLMPAIDRESAVPPYMQVANALRTRIDNGEIPPGRALPSLVKLEDEFGAARDTLRKAVQVLKDEGRVQTVRGMGVYVLPLD